MGGVVRLPAPLRLLSFPGLLLAMAGAATILGMVSSSSELFLSSSGGAAVRRFFEEGAEIRTPALTLVIDSSVSAEVIGYRTGLLESDLGEWLKDPVLTARGDTVTLRAGGDEEEVRIVTRTGALDQVDRLDEGTGQGVWLADYTAERLGVEVGDRVRLVDPDARTTALVAGIYGDLLTRPRTPFWAPLDQFIYPAAGADTRPPAFMLMDFDQYVALEDELLDNQDVISWEFPLPTEPMSIEAAHALADRLSGFRGRLSDGSTALGAAFRRVNYNEPFLGWVDQAEDVVTSIRGPVEALALAGRAVALAVIAGAALFMVRRRRVEVAVLNARGIGPLRLGARTAAEAALPIALGAAAGFGLSLVAIHRFGPGGVLSPSSVRGVGGAVAVTAAIAVGLLAVVAGSAVREQTEHGADRVRRVASRVPWELILLGVAGAAFYGLRAGGTSAEAAEAAPQLDRLFLLFPILFLAGAAGLAARGLRAMLPWLRRAGSGWRPAPYLASRRLAAAPRLATSLMVAAALAVGILVYAATLASSVKATASQDAALHVGSDVAARYSGPRPDLETIPLPVTPVIRVGEASFASATDVDFDVLAVDPATFASAAFWRGEFSEDSLESLMDGLADDSSDRLPIVLAGGASAPADPVLELPGFDFPVRVVGTARTFPGSVGERPVVAIAVEGLESALEAQDFSLARLADASEVWARGSEQELVETLRARDVSVIDTISAEELRSTPRYLALISMFRYLQALGILAGMVVLIGALMYLQTRQRQGESAYALILRMGLSRGSHRRSVLMEVAGLLLSAFVIGSVLAAAASFAVNAEVQARPVEATVALFRLPLTVFGAAAGILLLFSWTGAAMVQRLADRADVAEVMRVAE
jgi:putative ABC transport system permease protein